MPFTSDMPCYPVDLALPERQRWGRVFADASGLARQLVREAEGEIEGIPAFIAEVVSRLF